jgi:hypothetical protein
VGLFLSPDVLSPVEPGVGPNRYAYTAGNPIDWSDPSGMLAIMTCANPQNNDWCQFSTSVTVQASAGLSFAGMGLLVDALRSLLREINEMLLSQVGADGRESDRITNGRNGVENTYDGIDNDNSMVTNVPPDEAGVTDLGGGSRLTRNAGFFVDWVAGTGSRSRKYRGSDPQLTDMKYSPGADYLRRLYEQRNCASVSDASYGTARAAFDTLANPFTRDWLDTSAQVGGFIGSVTGGADGTATYSITNVAGTRSFFYHAAPDRSSPHGMMSNITQSFVWNEASPCR